MWRFIDGALSWRDSSHDCQISDQRARCSKTCTSTSTGGVRGRGGSSAAAEKSRLKEVQMFLRKARAAPHPLHQHREQHKDAANARTHAPTRTLSPARTRGSRSRRWRSRGDRKRAWRSANHATLLLLHQIISSLSPSASLQPPPPHSDLQRARRVHSGRPSPSY